MADSEERGIFEEMDDFQEFKQENWKSPPTKDKNANWNQEWDKHAAEGESSEGKWQDSGGDGSFQAKLQEVISKPSPAKEGTDKK